MDADPAFEQWKAAILAAWPDAHITYSIGIAGVSWAEAWDEDTRDTLATYPPPEATDAKAT